MNLLSVIVFLLVTIFILLSIRKGGDILSPTRVFGLTWCIVLGLADLKLSGLQHTWGLNGWLLALLGPCSFILGLFIAYIINFDSRFLTINEMRQIMKNHEIKDASLFNFIIVAFVAYIFGYLIIYLVKGYLPLFTFRPGAARIEYSVFGVGLFIHHMPIIIYFSIVYHLFSRGRYGKKTILKFIMLITLITYLFLLQRYQLIMISMMAFTLLYYTTKYIRLKTMLIFIGLGILIIYLIATLRAGQVVQKVLYVTSEMKFAEKYAIFTEPYMYMVMSIENFVRATSQLDQHTYGYFTFDFALALTGLKHWISNYFKIVENPFLISGYNTYTIFWTFYRDFGILGISIFPLVAGYLVGSVYYTMRRNPTIRNISFYGVIMFIMALSFFLSPLGFLWFVYIIVWMAVILKFTNVKPLSKEIIAQSASS